MVTTQSDKPSYKSIFAPGLFQDQTVVVTGGGSGIGRCTAHELASLGVRVVITGRKQEKLDRVAAEITEDGGDVTTHSFDVRDPEAANAAMVSVIESHGRIDALINNAGGQFAAPLSAISPRGFERVVASNLNGNFHMMRAVFDAGMRETGGAIVNMAMDLRNGAPSMGHSGASRAGVINLSQTAAFEWGPLGIRTNVIAPGWAASSGFDTYDAATQATFAHLHHHVPLRRLASEAEISSAICFLISPGAAFVNGITLPVNGGADQGGSLYNTLFQTGSAKIAGVNPDPANAAYDGFHRAVPPDAFKRDDEEAP